MNYDLKSPCPHCPFRNDINPYLTAERVEEIRESLDRGTFTCHETTVEVDCDDGGGEMKDGPNAQHCAGALILMEKCGESSQMTRIAERLGMYNHKKLNMDSPVFDCWEDMVDCQPE